MYYWDYLQNKKIICENCRRRNQLLFNILWINYFNCKLKATIKVLIFYYLVMPKIQINNRKYSETISNGLIISERQRRERLFSLSHYSKCDMIEREPCAGAPLPLCSWVLSVLVSYIKYKSKFKQIDIIYVIDHTQHFIGKKVSYSVI